MATFGRSIVLLRLFKQPLRDFDIIRHTVKAAPIVFQNNYNQCHCNYSSARSISPHILRNRQLQAQKKRLVKRTIVDVWKGMTASQFAQGAGKSFQNVQDALHCVTGVRFKEDQQVNDIEILYAVGKLINVSCRNVKTPECVEKPVEKNVVHKRKPVNEADLIPRRPIVTVMGHVDHGKTTLLDALRSTSVAAAEFGGITQHIGTFNVTLKTGEKITFLDTPGHAAFTRMRARGAQVTDIVILVVAADDGVMAQTVESINMAQEANVPIVVAINKIDKPNANIDRTMSTLAQNGILVEEKGGDVQAVQISALKKINLDLLVETVAMQAELMNLKGDPKGLAEGVVIETTNSQGRGKLATVLILRGQLKKNSVIVCGPAWAKVRSMFDDAGRTINSASLSDAVQVTGWREVPSIGKEFYEVESESKARQLAELEAEKVKDEKALEQNEQARQRWLEVRQEYERVRKLKAQSVSAWKIKMNLDETDNTPKVNIVVKGDVAGFVDAILDILATYSDNRLCHLNVVNYGVGSVSESDIMIAEAFDGIIYYFNVPITPQIANLAKEKNVSVRSFNVIYRFIDDLKKELSEKMPKVSREIVHGEARVQKQFDVSEKKKKVAVAGCICTSGVLKMNALYRLIRDGEVIHTGPLVSMKHMKQEVRMIKEKTECGLRFEKPGLTFEEGDIIVCFSHKMEKAELTWDPGF